MKELLLFSVALFIMFIPGLIKGFYNIAKGNVDTFFTIDQSLYVFVSACMSYSIIAIWIFAAILYFLKLLF